MSGGMLSNRDIIREIELGNLMIEPFDVRQLQPASYDVRLGDEIAEFEGRDDPVDPLRDLPATKPWWLTDHKGGWHLDPGEFVLGTTVEHVRVPDYMCVRIEGKSSLGRLGLLVHATAGFVDPGFEGNLTLEILNVSNSPIWLTTGMPIAQLSFMYLHTPADPVYGSAVLKSRYQGQLGTTPSRGVA